MSEKEKEMIEQLNKLPENLQDKFVQQVTGAAMAIDTLKASEQDN